MSPENEARFLALLGEHQAILHKVAYGYCRDRDDRADLVQEMAVQLWRSFPRFDARSKFSTWAYRVAMNVAISRYRGEGRRLRDTSNIDDLATEPAFDDPFLDGTSDNMRVLQRLVAGLDELNRALILLYLDGHSSEEIADVLGISAGNVTTRMNRLKQRLQDEFARLEKETPK